MADNRLYGGSVVNPAMHGQAQVTPKGQALEGYTGSGASNLIGNANLTSEYDPYHRLKMNFLRLAGDAVDKGIEASRNRAYIDGMSKAMSGQAEEAIQSSFLTRNWGRAGYRDTEGRLALIDYKATALDELSKNPELQSMPPEAYQRYLAVHKERLMGYIDNASTETQGKLLEALVGEDASLITKQAEAFQSYRLNQEIGIHGRELNLSLLELNEARGSAATYEIAVAKAGQLVNTIFNNPNLDIGVRNKIVQEYMEALNSNGHPDVVNLLTSQAVFNVDGKDTSLAELMPYDSFTDVLKGTRNSMKAEKADRLKYMIGDIHAMIEDAAVNPDFDFNTTEQMIFNAIGTTGLSTSEGFGYIKKLREIQRNSSNDADVMYALYAGNKEELRVRGITPKNAITQMMKGIKELPVVEKIGRLKEVANAGIYEAYDGIGDIASGTFAKLMNSEYVLDDSDQSIMNMFVDIFNTEDFTYSPQDKFDRIMSGITDTTTASFMEGAFNRYMLKNPANLNASEASLAWLSAVDAQREDMQRNPYYQKNVEARLADAIAWVDHNNTGETYSAFNFLRMSPIGSDASKGIKPQSEFGEWFNWALGMLPGDVQVSRGSTALNYKVTSTFSDYQKTVLDRSIKGGAEGLPAQLSKKAGQDVAKASFLISGDNFEGSYVGMPGATVSDMLGRANFDTQGFNLVEISQEIVGDFAAEYTAGIGRGDLKVEARYENGNLILQGISSNGIYQDTMTFNNNTLVQRGRDLVESRKILTGSAQDKGIKLYVPTSLDSRTNANTSSRQVGGTSTVQKHYADLELNINSVIGGGYQVDFSPDEIMLIRNSLVEQEAVRTQRYKDGKNSDGTDKYSVGIGINEGNMHFPKRIQSDSDELTQEELNDTFIKASSWAMADAAKVVKELPEGRDSSLYGMLMTHMKYQQGNITNAATRELRKAIIEGDTEKAMELMQNTPAWNYSGEGRRMFYMDLINNI